MFIGRDFLDLPAPLGAECKSSTQNHIALRWSALPIRLSSYKHVAPPEQFAMQFPEPNRLFVPSFSEIVKLT